MPECRILGARLFVIGSQPVIRHLLPRFQHECIGLVI